MKYIEYVVVQKIEGDLSGLNRSEIIAKADEQNTKLIQYIQEKFPTVKVTHKTVFGPFIDIPEDNAEEIVGEIGHAFNCVLMRGDTPIELVE